MSALPVSLRIRSFLSKVAFRLYLPAVFAALYRTAVWMFRPKVTLQYPEQKRVTRQGYRGVHRLKKDEEGRPKCVACFMCQTACPAECIEIVAGEAPWSDREKVPVSFRIDMLKCIYCGMCEEACPCDAIELTERYSQVATSREEMIYDMARLLEN